MNKTILRISLFAAALPLAALAQNQDQTQVPVPSNSSTSESTTSSAIDSDYKFTPADNGLEFTLGGSGVSNKKLDNSAGGVNFSAGKYISDSLLVSIRQTVNYNNPNTGGTAWDGSTLAAIDEHFGHSVLRPFLGVNLGGIYGDGVKDTWAAGLEGGLKYYMQPRTFLFALAEYEWLFEKGEQVHSQFNQGQFIWTVGVGFNL